MPHCSLGISLQQSIVNLRRVGAHPMRETTCICFFNIWQLIVDSCLKDVEKSMNNTCDYGGLQACNVLRCDRNHTRRCRRSHTVDTYVHSTWHVRGCKEINVEYVCRMLTIFKVRRDKTCFSDTILNSGQTNPACIQIAQCVWKPIVQSTIAESSLVSVLACNKFWTGYQGCSIRWYSKHNSRVWYGMVYIYTVMCVGILWPSEKRHGDT